MQKNAKIYARKAQSTGLDPSANSQKENPAMHGGGRLVVITYARGLGQSS